MSDKESDFQLWEDELGPEITGIGKPMNNLSREEIQAKAMRVGITVLNGQLERGLPRDQYEEIYDSTYRSYYGDAELQ